MGSARRIFEITALDDVLPIAETRSAALAAELEAVAQPTSQALRHANHGSATVGAAADIELVDDRTA